MAVLPKGVYAVEHKTKAGTVLRYQAKAMINGIKYSKTFEEIAEAKAYLTEVRSHFGRKAIDAADIAEAKALEEFKKPLFEWFFNCYFDYKYPEKEFQANLMKKKQYATYKSFFKTILNTEIQVFNEDTLEDKPHASEILNRYGFGSSISKKTKLGKLRLHQVNYKTINAYIKKRLELGKSKITVRKELSIISCFFNEVKYIPTIPTKSVEDLGNPTKEIDKKLLSKAYNKEKAKRIDEDNFEKIKNCIYNEDLDFSYALLLQYFGAFRMSEAIYLTWENIDFKEKKIKLPQTKTLPRVVYMSKDLEDLLETIEPEKEKQKGLVLKTQTYYKYQKQIQRFRERYGFELVTHQLRKDAISRMIDKVGKDNSIVLSEILGFTNVKNFEINYIEEEARTDTLIGVMKNVGHTEKSKNITKNAYYSLPKLKN